MSGKKAQSKPKALKQKTRGRKSTTRSASRKQSKGAILAPFATNPMKRMNMTTRSRDGSSCRIRGTDFLTSVSIGGTAAVAGDVLVSQLVNPAQLSVARLATMSRLYERYKFKSLKFRYSPVANATISGQLIGYVDYDTYDDPTGSSGTQNLQRAAAHYGEKPVQVWQGSEKPVFWEIKDVDPLTDLYVDSDGSDPRWTNQGRFVLLAASAIAANTACGNVYLDYDIEFYIPQIEVTPSNGYATKLSGSTSCTTSAILGTTISASTWSNLPLATAMSGNTFSVHPGSYLVTTYITGGTISSFGVSTTGTTVVSYSHCINAAATAAVNMIQFYCTGTASVTYTAAATSIANGEVFVCMLPRNALTVSSRKMDLLSRLLKEFDKAEVKSLVSSSSSSSSQDSKESKTELEKEEEREIARLKESSKPLPLTRTYTSMSSSSTSSSSSGSMGSDLFRSRVDDDYVRVKQRS